MNNVTIVFAKYHGLEILNLSDMGVTHMWMRTADGRSTQLKHYTNLDVSIEGIWRRIRYFVLDNEESTHPTDGVHLLLGLP